MDFIYRHLYRVLFICSIFTLSINTYAKAVMNVTPTTLGAITLGVTSTITIDYSVQNNTNQILTRFSIDPGYNVKPSALSAISLKTNACNPLLPPGATCAFQIQLQGNIYLPNSFILSPRVCAYTIGSGAGVCSQPIAEHRSPVFVEPVITGCSANGYGSGCYVMISKNRMQGNMSVLSPAPTGAPNVSICNSMGSVSKADCICNIEGLAANRGNGTWRAWLGLTTGGDNNPRQRLNNLLGHAAYPPTSSWISHETGLTVYANWGSLGVNIFAYPPVMNVISNSNGFVNTGGSNDPASTLASTCNDWSSANGATLVDVGQTNGTVATNNDPNSWNNATQLFCDVYRPIYCTEVSP